MLITSVSVSYKFTRNLGNYSSVSPSMGVTATVKEDDDLEAVTSGLWAMCETEVNAVIRAVLAEQDRVTERQPRT